MVMSHKYITMCWAQLEIVDARCESRHTLRILSRVVEVSQFGKMEYFTTKTEQQSTKGTRLVDVTRRTHRPIPAVAHCPR